MLDWIATSRNPRRFLSAQQRRITKGEHGAGGCFRAWIEQKRRYADGQKNITSASLEGCKVREVSRWRRLNLSPPWGQNKKKQMGEGFNLWTDRHKRLLQSQTAWSAETGRNESTVEEVCKSIVHPFRHKQSLGFISLLIVCFKNHKCDA